MRTTKKSTKHTVSVRVDNELVARVQKYCEHMRKWHKIEVSVPTAMRALIEVGLDVYDSGARK